MSKTLQSNLQWDRIRRNRISRMIYLFSISTQSVDLISMWVRSMLSCHTITYYVFRWCTYYTYSNTSLIIGGSAQDTRFFDVAQIARAQALDTGKSRPELSQTATTIASPQRTMACKPSSYAPGSCDVTAKKLEPRICSRNSMQRSMGQAALQCISPIQLIQTFILPDSKPFRGSPFFGDIGTSQGLSQDFSPMLRHQHGVLPLRTPITILRKDCPTIFQGIRNFGTSFLRVLKGYVWKNNWKWCGERGRHVCPSCTVYDICYTEKAYL